jgi:hypothetical protein
LHVTIETRRPTRPRIPRGSAHTFEILEISSVASISRLKLHEVAPSRSYALNPLDFRSGRLRAAHPATSESGHTPTPDATRLIPLLVPSESLARSPVWCQWYGGMARRVLGESLARSGRRSGNYGSASARRGVCMSPVWWYGSASARRLGESFAWSPMWWYGSASARREFCMVTGMVVWLSDFSARALQGHRCGRDSASSRREFCMVTGVVVWWYGSASAQRVLSERFARSPVWW